MRTSDIHGKLRVGESERRKAKSDFS